MHEVENFLYHLSFPYVEFRWNSALTNFLHNEKLIYKLQVAGDPFLAFIMQYEAETKIEPVTVGPFVFSHGVYGGPSYIVRSNDGVKVYRMKQGSKVIDVHLNRQNIAYGKMTPFEKVRLYGRALFDFCSAYTGDYSSFSTTKTLRKLVQETSDSPIIGVSHLGRLLLHFSWRLDSEIPAFLVSALAGFSRSLSHEFGGSRDVSTRDLRTVCFYPEEFLASYKKLV